MTRLKTYALLISDDFADFPQRVLNRLDVIAQYKEAVTENIFVPFDEPYRGPADRPCHGKAEFMKHQASRVCMSLSANDAHKPTKPCPNPLRRYLTFGFCNGPGV